jgi:hypothetical protein
MTEVPEPEVKESETGEAEVEDFAAKFENQKAITRRLEQRTKSDKAKLDALIAEVTQLREGAKPKTDEPTVDQIREQARAEAKAEAMAARVLDKIEAKAAREFEHPEDVSAFLAKRTNDFLNDGSIDMELITDALNELKTARPGWLIVKDERRFKGSADGGVAREKPLSIQDQIQAAEQAKDFQTSMGLKINSILSI